MGACAPAGIKTSTPVELYEDPVKKTGIRPEHNLLVPAVQEAALAEIAELPGPNVSNVILFGPPCGSLKG